MSFVLDASVTMGWCFADQADDYSRGVLRRLQRSSAIVPALWLLEVRNVLLTNERRNHITQEASNEFLAILDRLNIRIHNDEFGLNTADVLALARKHRLTIYDATYLDLARRQSFPLATRDKALLIAAPLADVPIFSPSVP